MEDFKRIRVRHAIDATKLALLFAHTELLKEASA